MTFPRDFSSIHISKKKNVSGRNNFTLTVREQLTYKTFFFHTRLLDVVPQFLNSEAAADFGDLLAFEKHMVWITLTVRAIATFDVYHTAERDNPLPLSHFLVFDTPHVVPPRTSFAMLHLPGVDNNSHCVLIDHSPVAPRWHSSM